MKDIVIVSYGGRTNNKEVGRETYVGRMQGNTG